MFDSDSVASTLLEKLNENSMRGLMTSVVNTMNTQAGSDLTGIQEQINIINTHMIEVEAEAKILSEDELAQVEQALKEVLTNLEANGFLGLLCVDVLGQKYSMKDLVARLSSVDRVASVEKIWDASYETIQSVKVVLEDASIITFVPTIDEDATFKNYTFNADWKGLPAEFILNFAKVERTMNISGVAVASTEYVATKKSNVLFSLTDGLGNCVETSILDTIPDLNEDGTIGNVPLTLSLASASGSAEAGSGAFNVAFADATGTVNAVSSAPAIATVAVVGSEIVVTPVAEGSATITVSDDANSVTYAMAVTAVPVTVTAMTADKTALSIDVGSTDTVTMADADGALTVVSSDPAKVGVTAVGSVVTINAIGATDPDSATVSISDGDDTVVVSVYTAVSGGGGL